MRSQDGVALASRVKRALPAADIESFDTVREAVGAARDRAGASDTILVFGSFETVAAATRAIG
jgi:folylpolyglutamate synthase/dihydropteroate synthase